MYNLPNAAEWQIDVDKIEKNTKTIRAFDQTLLQNCITHSEYEPCRHSNGR